MSAQKLRKHIAVAILFCCLPAMTSSQTLSRLVATGIVNTHTFSDLLSTLESRMHRDPNDYEAHLLKGIIDFHLGKTRAALDGLTRLTNRAPDFHLAHLVRADLLASRVKTLNDIGAPGLLNKGNTKATSEINALREEVIARFRANLANGHTTKIPFQLLQLNSSMQTALLVDKSRNRLYVYERSDENLPPRYVRDFYVSTGQKKGNKYEKGDLKTPEGVYFITSWLPDDKLPEKYGIGAFPTDYPNTFDRKLGKTGYGIWLHGTDRIYYSRPPLDSEGCVVLSNIDLESIKQQIKPGVTPIVIADKIDWVSQQQWQQARASLLGEIESWRKDWESLNVDRYLSHYGQGFWNSKHNLSSWNKYKRRVARNKTYQKIALNDIAMFYYPRKAAGKDMVVVRFRQDYQSNNFKSSANKKIYLGKENADWKIIYEGK